ILSGRSSYIIDERLCGSLGWHELHVQRDRDDWGNHALNCYFRNCNGGSVFRRWAGSLDSPCQSFKEQCDSELDGHCGESTVDECERSCQDRGFVVDQSIADLCRDLRGHVCEYCRWSQQHARTDVSVGRGWREELLVQLQPGNQQQLRQPEDLLHRNALLDNGNSLQPEQFKIRHVRSNTIDEGGRKQSPRTSFFLFRKQLAV